MFENCNFLGSWISKIVFMLVEKFQFSQYYSTKFLGMTLIIENFSHSKFFLSLLKIIKKLVMQYYKPLSRNIKDQKSVVLAKAWTNQINLAKLVRMLLLCCLKHATLREMKANFALISTSHWAISMTPLLEHIIGKPNLAKECRLLFKGLIYSISFMIWIMVAFA